MILEKGQVIKITTPNGSNIPKEFKNCLGIIIFVYDHKRTHCYIIRTFQTEDIPGHTTWDILENDLEVINYGN
jgi:hypothetical protein